MPSASHRLTYPLLAAVIVLWGVNWPVMKVGLTYIPPFWFAAARLALGAATLFALLAALGRLALPPRRDLPVLFSVSILQMTVFLCLVNTGLLTVGAGRSAVLAYTTPLWVTPAALLLGERLTPRKTLGLALGLAGLATLFNPLGFDWGDRDVVVGNGLLMLAALSWAGAILHVRRHAWAATPLDIAPWQMLAALPVLVALAAWREGPAFGAAAVIDWQAPDLWWVLAYNGPVATAFCYWAAVTVSRGLPSIHTTIGFLGVPAVGVLSAALTIGEAVPLDLVLGGLLILAGLTAMALGENRQAEN
jgi:drug/metabolite transporter (DMT)-like permease